MQQTPRSLVEKIVFNKPSAIVHTVIFGAWFVFHWGINLLTNVVSLEAIYLSIFIGIGTANIHHHVDKLNKRSKK